MSRQGNRHWSGRTYQRLTGFGLACSLYALLLANALLLPTAQANPTEAELRAAVIVAIMRFTAWPPASPHINSELDVCLAGNPISAVHLLPVSGQQKVAGHTLNVKPITNGNVTGCDVLVVGGSERSSDLLQAADAASVLSICDGCKRDLGNHAIIRLTLRRQRVNFEVNLAKAKHNGLALDAQLLELASVVRK